MTKNNKLNIRGAMTFSILACFILIISLVIQNDNIEKVEPVQEYNRVQALCPFLCIDNGYNGGYYTNLINECVCIKN